MGGNTYGLTEAFPLTTLPLGVPAPPGSSGKANDTDFDVRLFDDDDREVAPGAVGEVVLLAINESRVLRSTKVAVAGWGSSCVGDVSGLGVWWGLWWRW